MPATILVTGATGAVGSHVVRQLSATDTGVRAGLHTSRQIADGLGKGVEPVELDFGRRDTVRAALVGVEKLFLLTPVAAGMVEMAAAAIQAARATNVRHIVRLSGLGAGAEPGITMTRLQRQIERLVEESGIPYTFLRPNTFMQNYLTVFGQSIRARCAFYAPMGQGKTSLIDARDVAAIAVAALTTGGHEGKIYDLTGAEALSNDDVAGVLSVTLRRRITYVDIPEDEARRRMLQSGVPAWLIETRMELYRGTKAGDASAITPVLEAVMGRPPRSFDEFARDHTATFAALPTFPR